MFHNFMTHNSSFKIHNSSESGVTLIEVLIYITILGFVMTGALMATYQILSGSQSLDYKNITEEEAGFIISKLNWALNDVSAINSPAANASGATLSVTKSGQTIEFARTLTGDDITIKKGSAAAVNLNSDWVAITSLNFEHIQNIGSSTSDSIRATFIINGKTFQTTRFIR